MTRLDRRLTWLVLLGLCPLAAGCGVGGPPAPVTIPPPTTLAPRPPGLHRQTDSCPGIGAVRYSLSVPAGYTGKRAVPLVVALHYGGDVKPYYGEGMIKTLTDKSLGDLGAITVAPDALRGGDWTTPVNEAAVVWLTRSVMASYNIDPKRVLLTGFSLGGQGTWYVGGLHQDLYTACLVVAGSPTVNVTEWSIPVYVIHSSSDTVLKLEPTRDHVKKIQEAGGTVELKITPGLDHYRTAAYATPMREAVPWLKKAWAQAN